MIQQLSKDAIQFKYVAILFVFAALVAAVALLWGENVALRVEYETQYDR